MAVCAVCILSLERGQRACVGLPEMIAQHSGSADSRVTLCTVTVSLLQFVVRTVIGMLGYRELVLVLSLLYVEKSGEVSVIKRVSCVLAHGDRCDRRPLTVCTVGCVYLCLYGFLAQTHHRFIIDSHRSCRKAKSKSR